MPGSPPAAHSRKGPPKPSELRRAFTTGFRRSPSRYATPPPSQPGGSPFISSLPSSLAPASRISADVHEFKVSAALGPRRTTLQKLKDLPALGLTANWHAEEYLAWRMHDRGYLTLRERIFRFLASPSLSPHSTALATVILTFNLISLITSAIENADEVYAVSEGRDPSRSFYYLNCIWAGLFGFELCDGPSPAPPPRAAPRRPAFCAASRCRPARARRRPSFAHRLVRLWTYGEPWLHWALWADALCYVPFVTRVALGARDPPTPLVSLDEPQRTILLLITAMLPLRLLKLTRWLTGTVLLRRAILRSATALVIPFFMLTMLFTLLGGIMCAAAHLITA